MLMANMAHVRRASLVCDPFVGSGQYAAFMHIHDTAGTMQLWYRDGLGNVTEQDCSISSII